VKADSITLQIPHEKPFHGVARLVVGGLAARLDLSYEHLEDLQLALATVLENEGYLVGSEVTVKLAVNPDSVGMVIGPLRSEQLRADLQEEDAGEDISLHRLLSTLVDGVELDQGEKGEWLRLEKRVPLKHPEPKGTP
jgi:hypothetical protein